MTGQPADDIPGAGGAGAHWVAYTEAVQHIAALLHDERHRAGQRAAVTRTGQAGVDQLGHRLAAQRQHLIQLAATLRLPSPRFGAVTPGPVTEPTEALLRAAAAADTADAAAQAAHRRAAEPPLLPGLPPPARNALVYAASAVAGTLLSLLMFFASTETDLGRIPWQLVPWSLCGFPALAFFAGYLTISLVGQPRIGERGTGSARLGGAICFIGMPIIWFIVIAASRG